MTLTPLQYRFLRAVARGKFPVMKHYRLATLESLIRRNLVYKIGDGNIALTDYGLQVFERHQLPHPKHPRVLQVKRLLRKRRREMAELERILSYHPSTRSKKPLQDIIFPKKGPN